MYNGRKTGESATAEFVIVRQVSPRHIACTMCHQPSSQFTPPLQTRHNSVNCIRDASRLSPTENLKSEHDFVLPDIKRDFNKRHYVARSLFVMSESYVFVLRRGTRVCIFIDNVVRLLFMQTCAINLLTYLQNNRPTLFTPSTPRHDETEQFCRVWAGGVNSS